MFEKIFTAQGIKDFFRVRDAQGNFSWEQVLATVIQLLLVCAVLYFLWLIELL